jgi:hypothetical protein
VEWSLRILFVIIKFFVSENITFEMYPLVAYVTAKTFTNIFGADGTGAGCSHGEAMGGIKQLA